MMSNFEDIRMVSLRFGLFLSLRAQRSNPSRQKES
jgi:hypothetical protein